MKKFLRTLSYITWIGGKFSIGETGLVLFGMDGFKLFSFQLVLPIYRNAFRFNMCLLGQEIEFSNWKKFLIHYIKFDKLIKTWAPFEK